MSQLVGRTAQVCNFSEAEWNNRYIFIQRHDSVDNVYSVMVLARPDFNSEIGMVLKVKLLNLNFTEPCFTSRFPGAIQHYAESFASATVPTLWDFSNIRFDEISDKPLHIKSSCCIRGVFVPGGILYSPRTRISGGLVVDCEASDSIVEFQDIHFGGLDSYIEFHDASTVVFRRCKFTHSCFIGAMRGYADKPVHVVFETCNFVRSVGNVLNVAAYARATLVNCVFEDVSSGVVVGPGGSAVLRHCKIYNATGLGVAVLPGGRLLEMLYCDLDTVKLGVNVAKCGRVLMQECSLRLCKGITVGGVYHAVINGGTMCSCDVGVRVVQGNNNISICNILFCCMKHNIVVHRQASQRLC